MHALIIAAALTGLGEAPAEVAYASYEQAATELADRLQTGSLLFTEGDCLAIRVYTHSPYTHVGIVRQQDGQTHVYDSMNGVGVRRMTLTEYLASQSPDQLHVYHPARTLTPEQSNELTAYLEAQLGTPYSIHHHLTGERADGVHCAEYVTDALMAIDFVHAKRPSRVSPASLAKGITTGGVYRSALTVEIDLPPPPMPVARNQCEQWWLDTKQCTSATCRKLSGWFLCR